MPSVMRHPSQSSLKPRLGNTVPVVNTTTAASTVLLPPGDAGIRTARFYLNSQSVTLTRTTTTNVYGAVKLGAMPAQAWVHLGSVARLAVTGDGTNIASTAPLVVAVGTVTAGNDATLTSTEANIVPSTAFTLVASTLTSVNASTVAPAAFYGLVTPQDLYLNIAGDNAANASATANGTVTVTGYIDMTYICLGG